MPLDSYNMITSKDLADIDGMEANHEQRIRFLENLEREEQEMWSWFGTTKQLMVEEMVGNDPDVFLENPTMSITLHNCLISMFFKGYKAAEAKWKPKDSYLYGLAGSYIPKDEDFK